MTANEAHVRRSDAACFMVKRKQKLISGALMHDFMQSFFVHLLPNTTSILVLCIFVFLYIQDHHRTSRSPDFVNPKNERTHKFSARVLESWITRNLYEYSNTSTTTPEPGTVTNRTFHQFTARHHEDDDDSCNIHYLSCYVVGVNADAYKYLFMSNTLIVTVVTTIVIR